jgi:hypothetical protein
VARAGEAVTDMADFAAGGAAGAGLWRGRFGRGRVLSNVGTAQAVMWEGSGWNLLSWLQSFSTASGRVRRDAVLAAHMPVLLD